MFLWVPGGIQTELFELGDQVIREDPAEAEAPKNPEHTDTTHKAKS